MKKTAIAQKEDAKLKRRINTVKLNSLLEITQAINNNLKVNQLLKIFQNVLINELKIGKMVLFINENGWRIVLKHGIKNEFEEIKVETDLLRFKEISDVKVISSSTSLQSFDVVIPVFHKAEPLAYLLIGDIDENKLEMSASVKHLPFIQTLSNIIVVAIENKKLAKDNLRQEGVKKEMELASDMQTMLFPSTLPNNEHIQTAALYQPHHKVGGDYYDFITLNDNEYAFCMADVSGKGISAALLMANFQANLRALFRYSRSLTEIVTELNRLVIENAKGEKFITLFVARYNKITRTLNYINAGHNPAVVVTPNYALPLTLGCIGIGMLDEIPKIREGIKIILPGSLLVSYTDGVTEQENRAGEQFGLKNLINTVQHHINEPVDQINETIVNALNAFRNGEPYADDVTLLTNRIL